MYKTIGVILILIGISVFIFVIYKNTNYPQTTRTFSDYSLLNSSWEKYSQKFINKDGRVIDDPKSEFTSSEAQSYALLRAVWVDDKPRFDIVWKWTKENLKRKEDNLFGWRWGKRADNSYGFLEGGGDNSASDADIDIALALILASRRWNQEEYLKDAQPILNDIWDKETIEVNTKRYLIAGNWANAEDKLVINPSYFAPYAWRIFQTSDTKKHNWNSLIDSSFEVLDKSSEDKLDKDKSVGLPPDWIVLIKNTSQISAPNIPGLTTNYSYDAVRVPFRVGLDYLWYQDPRSIDYLKKAFVFLEQEYKKEGKLYSSYDHAGNKLTDIENPVMYATSLGYFKFTNPDIAQKIYQEKIINLYSNATDNFKEDLPYYEQNWLWFGAAFYNNFLSDFKQ